MQYGDKRDYAKIDLFTMSPSTGRWQYAGTTTWSRTVKDAARRFQALHPEQTVAACSHHPNGRFIRP